MIKAGKLSHLIKELKQGGKDQLKAAKKEETSEKDKAMEILMVQPWQKVARQKITQSFSPDPKISFPPLGEEDGTEGLIIIEAKISGHFIHHMADIAAVKIGDAEHSTSTWMNFMVVRSPSPYNGIIGRPGVRKIQAAPSTAYEILHNLDISAWKPANMKGVPRHIAEHRLNVLEGYSPVRQKKRVQTPKRNKAIQEEVEKLVDPGIMKDAHYHSWLSKPVMVKKHDDSWRMCVDFKDLNNAYPKDGYQLPEIDWKVESLCGYPFKSFLDAYKGYHQIKMAKEDEEKTTFFTSQGIFCYSKMPFGLKNTGAIYQRLVDKAFQKQIGRNLEVYMDDLLIKSPEAAFKQMKQLIVELSTLTSPMENEELIMYLAVAQEAVSAILMAKREAKQMSVYFVSLPCKTQK
ncbi:reverse transcriptase domain-containing protein [Tanacetum coccineum]